MGQGRFGSLRTGPKLARRLSAVELGSLPDEQVLDYLQAQSRQLSFQQAEVWRAMAEVGRRAPFAFDHGEVWTAERRFDSAVNEIVAELRVSKPTATHELEHAQHLESLPAVAAALRAGELDRNRVLVLLDVCSVLSDEHAQQVLDEVLPDAGSMPAGKLRAKAEKVAIALDPEWAERRYRQAVRHKRVVSYIADDGTVTLTGENLPADEALAAKAHVWALAKAAKRAGAHASADALRATLFTGLLDRRFLGLNQSGIIAALVTQFPKPSDQAAQQPADQAEAPDAEPGGQPQSAAKTAPAGPVAPAEPATPEPAAPAAPDLVIPAGVELRIGLASLMGLTDEPGEIAGTGPVPASVARRIAETQRRGEWRFVIVDDAGHALFDGITRHRPTGYPGGGERGGLVELHVPTYLLDPAFLEEHPTWARLLTDLSRQYERQAPIVQNPAARLPGDPLRRRVEITHRYCLFPTCRRPAADSQTDHRHDYAKGGPTLENNLGPLCERHHDLKTRWGWRLAKRDDQTYVWISPLGRRHLVTIEPVAPPLPHPLTSDPPDMSAA